MERTILLTSLFWIFSFGFSLFGLDPHLFYKVMSEPTPSWMIEQINKDLDLFKNEYKFEFLEKIYEENGVPLLLARIKAKNGVLTIDRRFIHPTAEMIYDGFQILHLLAPLPDFDLILSGHDAWNESFDPPMPIFIEAKDKTINSFILLPDRFALHGYLPQKNEVLEGNLIFPWEVKRRILFFRGSDTGANSISWRDCPRPKLVALSLKNPDLIDARLVGLHFKEWFDEAQREGFFSPFVSMTEHLFYRYLVDVDGNCASCPRTATLLHSNSVVLKQMTNSVQWFYSTLKPYEHFVPFKDDLSDLLEQTRWAMDHDEECRKISLNARFLARDVLSEERVYQYLYRLLEEYSKRQKLVFENQ